jgi:glucokinase
VTHGLAIGIDVGGTKTNAFRVARDGAILVRHRERTPADDPQATIQTLITLARAALSPEVVAIGVGAAGLVDVASGTLRFAPNLAWREVAIASRLRDAVGLPVQVDNDANAAAYAEYRFGAGRGYRHMLLVTVGTGIGGGIVSDGRLFRGAHGFASEVGHIIVEPGGPECGCGNRGCWEQVAAGRAIGRLGREAASAPDGAGILQRAGGDPEAVTGVVVTRAALDGDRSAIEVLAEVGRRLGEGIAGLVNTLDPQVVVVGGGAMVAGDLLLEPARTAFSRSVEGGSHRPAVPIVAAEMGNDAGAVGAAILALEELGDRPVAARDDG